MKKTTLAVILGAMMAWATAGVCEDQPGAAAAPEKQAVVAVQAAVPAVQLLEAVII